ncbi:hypothetical protein WJX81_003158 [Elliptochloris bilobata]|uniref:NAD(+) diphosphatase n=1 Tax=Elliptochloris bilobata TaxID=381761 RepID=A0AAW1RS31_9CHLO
MASVSDAVATAPELVAQSFGGNTLERTLPARRDTDFLSKALPAARLLLVLGRGVCVRAQADASGAPKELASLSLEELEQLGIVPSSNGTGMRLNTGGASLPQPYLLGQDAASVLRLVLDASDAGDALAERLASAGLQVADLRALMPQLEATELAVAGHAVALSQWHVAHRFCGRCGAEQVPIEAGAKRQCTADPRHRVYPRTDPVAIMLVESAAGDAALLGRPRSLRGRGAVLTCLSGFIEQGEAIEEAVRREVAEEAGVPVGPVQILGSQPWPIGRGGGCELMIGCVAKAVADEIHTDQEEMEEVRWVSRANVLEAVAASAHPDNPYYGNSTGAPAEGGLDFFIPPPWAIAHHLIKAWASRPVPWFSSRL